MYERGLPRKLSSAALVFCFFLSNASLADILEPGELESIEQHLLQNDSYGWAIGRPAGENFIATFSRRPEGSALDHVFVLRYDASSEYIDTTGDVIDVATSGRNASHADIAVAPSAEFMVAWMESDSPGAPTEVRARVYDAEDKELGDVVIIPSGSVPKVATAHGETYVLAWNTDQVVHARIFSRAGAVLTDEIEVSSPDVFSNVDDVTMLPDGSFLVTWSEYDDITNRYTVRVSKYRADGEKVFGSVSASATTDRAGTSRVAAAPDGTFMVAFNVEEEFANDLKAQRFRVDGAAIGDSFVVSQKTDEYQTLGSMSSAPDGSYLIVWADFGDSYNTMARAFLPNGKPAGDEFLVNEQVAGFPFAVATNANGNAVVGWLGDGGTAFAARIAGGGVDLSSSISAETSSVEAGSNVTIVARVKNDTTPPVTGSPIIDQNAGSIADLVVTFTLQEGTDYFAPGGDNWSCSYQNPSIICRYTAVLRPREEATLGLILLREEAGEISVAMEATSFVTGDTDVSDNAAQASVKVVAKTGGDGSDSGGGGSLGLVFVLAAFCVASLGKRCRLTDSVLERLSDRIARVGPHV